ncbi:MAG TPA: hypothetical protein PLI43_04285 [Albidovulum sp.]|uniref:hypothetical protein n=1 Tax=Albidovulum sp. TaxID=1872424 RepID=UPI002B91ED87|nr:hypothetical protein [Albidovulum sp.]
MQTFDDKVDAAVHAAFMALGLSAATRWELACRLSDFIAQEFRSDVTGDEEDGDDGSEATTSRQPDDAGSVGGEGGSSDD